jgi:small subunit ribosomal protein S6
MTDEQADVFIDKLGVEFTGRQKLGKRMFAFPINKQKEGNYILCDMKALPSVVTELNQKLRHDESVIRYLLIEQEKN